MIYNYSTYISIYCVNYAFLSIDDEPLYFFICLFFRPSFLKNVLDKVGGYLVQLQTLSPTTPDLTSVTTGLRDLERRIQATMKK